MSALKTSIYQFVKYGFVGLVNTAITASVIFALMYVGFGVYFSNACGYIIGIIVSFIINSLFTFSRNLSFERLVRFLLVCAICYGVNLMMVWFILTIFPGRIYIAQLLGMIVYTGMGFVLNKIWAFK